jgi:hypothetical protein
LPVVRPRTKQTSKRGYRPWSVDEPRQQDDAGLESARFFDRERLPGDIALKIGYGLIADIKKHIIAGETADVVILSR